MSITRFKTNRRMSQAVVHGDTVYLAGQVAADNSADVAGQTEQILGKIDSRLAEAGTDKSKLLSAQIWLTLRRISCCTTVRSRSIAIRSARRSPS